jgi:hypothetical protein
LHINHLLVRYQQLDCRMDVLLVHETLAPLPLVCKPQVSLLIEALFTTVEFGLLLPLLSLLLPSQVGWVTLHQLLYLKKAYKMKEWEVTCSYLFRSARLLRFGCGVQRPHWPYLDLQTLMSDYFCDGSKVFLKLSHLLSRFHFMDH